MPFESVLIACSPTCLAPSRAFEMANSINSPCALSKLISICLVPVSTIDDISASSNPPLSDEKSIISAALYGWSLSYCILECAAAISLGICEISLLRFFHAATYFSH